MSSKDAGQPVHGLKRLTASRSLALGVTSLTLALGLAACGSSSPPTANSGNSSTSTTTATTSSSTASTSAAPSTTQCTIPQNNGGDHDADNNGGPNDGDGCDR